MSAAAALRALHVPGRPLVLPNAWDVASARRLAALGGPALATTSGGVAESLGFEDGGDIPADEALAAAARIAAAVDVPVTADLEAGFGLPPDELAERLRATGAVGCNLEDTDHAHGGLRDAGEQAAYLAAVRAADPDLVLNARIDVHVRGGSLDDGLARARAYRKAGADCVYPITCEDEAGIAAYVEAARVVNVHLRPSAPPIARLAALGVARASFGTSLFRAALEAAAQRAAAP